MKNMICSACVMMLTSCAQFEAYSKPIQSATTEEDYGNGKVIIYGKNGKESENIKIVPVDDVNARMEARQEVRMNDLKEGMGKFKIGLQKLRKPKAQVPPVSPVLPKPIQSATTEEDYGNDKVIIYGKNGKNSKNIKIAPVGDVNARMEARREVRMNDLKEGMGKFKIGLQKLRKPKAQVPPVSPKPISTPTTITAPINPRSFVKSTSANDVVAPFVATTVSVPTSVRPTSADVVKPSVAGVSHENSLDCCREIIGNIGTTEHFKRLSMHLHEINAMSPEQLLEFCNNPPKLPNGQIYNDARFVFHPDRHPNAATQKFVASVFTKLDIEPIVSPTPIQTPATVTQEGFDANGKYAFTNLPKKNIYGSVATSVSAKSTPVKPSVATFSTPVSAPTPMAEDKKNALTKACTELKNLKKNNSNDVKYVMTDEFSGTIREIVNYLHTIWKSADSADFRIIQTFVIAFHKWRDAIYFNSEDIQQKEAWQMLDALPPVLDCNCFRSSFKQELSPSSSPQAAR